MESTYHYTKHISFSIKMDVPFVLGLIDVVRVIFVHLNPPFLAILLFDIFFKNASFNVYVTKDIVVQNCTSNTFKQYVSLNKHKIIHYANAK